MNYSRNSNYDVFVYLAYRNDNGGTAGIAYTGVTCDKDPQLRSTLNEYTGNDLTSGQVIRLKQEWVFCSKVERIVQFYR